MTLRRTHHMAESIADLLRGPLADAGTVFRVERTSPGPRDVEWQHVSDQIMAILTDGHGAPRGGDMWPEVAPLLAQALLEALLGDLADEQGQHLRPVN